MRKVPKRDLVVSGGIAGAAMAVVIAAGAALVASSPMAFAACGVSGAMKTAFGQEQVKPPADVYIVNFAANSADLNPVAERVLTSAAAAYPEKPMLDIQLRGAEQIGSAPEVVDQDRHAIVTAYLVRHDVPLSAIAFDRGQMAQMGCNDRGA
jgi:hypothetical protein